MLKINNLTKLYQNGKGIKDLSIHIKPGEIYGFIGHNGAGKTTTLKSVAGITPFDSGEVLIDGISIKDEPLRAKKIMAYIPDNPDIYDFMKGIAYLDFIADIYGVKEERKELIDKYATLFEIKDSLSEPVSSYSHGMKQKLVIISALIHSPKLLLMDEPFVGLDPKATHIFKEIMKDICKNGGSVFFSTHVLDVAEKLCDEVAIVKDSVLIKSGTMEEVKGDDSLEDVFLELEG
ncbi:MAG: ABC transporter ATP-binding protein [Clostridia bacterium]|nr:ABC transporter ATP-binding protein [Clostridia bacterium]